MISQGAPVDRFGLESHCWAPGVEMRGPAGVVAAAQAAVSGTQPALDPQALFDYLNFHCIPSPRTVYRGVHRLPAGHRWDAGPPPSAQPVPVPRAPVERHPSFAALREEFLALLEQSVRDRLDGSKPACFLSGGTDSSTVAGLISKVAGTPAATFSIGFEAEGYDEMAYARIAAQAYGCEHHEYYVTPDDLVQTIPMVAASFDQPFGNSSAVPAYHCALRAREAGVSRLLAGDGGDELFGGNTRYAKQKVFAAYGQVPGWLRTGVLEPVLLRSPVGRLPGLRKAASYVRQARIPMPDRMHTYNLLDRLGQSAVLTPAFLSQVDGQGPAAHQRAVWQGLAPGTELDHMLEYDWRYTLAENDLVKVVGATRLAGIDVAFPLLDERLVAFSQRLPAHYKVRGLRLRWFFKEALRGFLPDAILTKKKQGFGLPFGVWATRHAALFELAEDAVQGTVRRGLVRAAFARELMRETLPQHPGYYGEMVWILMMLEHWLRVHAPDFQLSSNEMNP